MPPTSKKFSLKIFIQQLEEFNELTKGSSKMYKQKSYKAC